MHKVWKYVIIDLIVQGKENKNLISSLPKHKNFEQQFIKLFYKLKIIIRVIINGRRPSK
jgi:hypothetical protein